MTKYTPRYSFPYAESDDYLVNHPNSVTKLLAERVENKMYDFRPIRAELVTGDSIDGLTGSDSAGDYLVQSTLTEGIPFPAHGILHVTYIESSSRTLHDFTAIRVSNPFSMKRIHSGGKWGEWVPVEWNGGLLASSVDIDTVRTLGVYGIQSSSNPNLPVAIVGTLEVMPATGRLLQVYTTWEDGPRVYRRILKTSTTWGAWKEDSTLDSERIETLEQRISAIPTAAIRSELQAPPATVESKSGSSIVIALSNDRSHGWNAYTSELRRSWDEGETWEPVVSGSNPFAGSTIESVRQLDNGELLVTNYIGSETRRAVWVSDGYSSGSPTFTRVLTARAEYIKFTSAWSQSDHGRIVLLNEYGPKTPDWSGNEIGPGDNARLTYMSMDYGKTWRTIFDLNEYLVEEHSHDNTDGQHLHGVAWDPWWDRIWVSFGDNLGGRGSNGIVYSDDLGSTWKTAHYFSGTASPHQVVGILPMPSCIIFAGDMGPNIVRINRTEGKNADGYATPIAWTSTAEGKHLCQSIHKPHRVGDDAPALFAFGSEGQSGPSFVVATLDGFTLTEIWRDSEPTASGFGVRDVVGPTLRGNVIVAQNDQRVSSKYSQITMSAPGY